jgi:importin subunit alpha-1
VLDAGVCSRLVELLGHASASVVTPALRTVGNIVTGNDKQTQAVLDSGGLARLGALLLSPKKGIRKEACWTISNIAGGTREQIQSVIDSNIIPPLVRSNSTAQSSNSSSRETGTQGGRAAIFPASTH